MKTPRPASRLGCLTKVGPLWLIAMLLLCSGANSNAQAAPQTKQDPGVSAPAAPSTNGLPSANLIADQPTTRQRMKAQKFYLEGLRAMDKKDVHTAEKFFARAHQEDPENPDYNADREIAREYGITRLVQDADKARTEGHLDEARAKLAEALKLDPKNSVATQHLDDLANLALPPSPAQDATATIAPPIDLQPNPGKLSFHLKGSQPEVLRKVFAAYGLNVVVEASVLPNQVRFDADDVDFAQAANLVQMATDSFVVPLDPKRALVAKDTKENRTQYERQALETLRLPGLTANEMSDMGSVARNVIGVTQVAVQPAGGTITVRAPESKLLALNKTLLDLLDGRSEVLLEVRLIEVDKSRSVNLGVQLPQSVSVFNVGSEANNIINSNQSLVQQIVSSGLANAGDTAAIVAVLIASGAVSGTILNQPFATFGGGLTESGLSFGPTTANFSINSSETRSLDQVQLRLQDKEEGTIRSGTRYPIETSNYSSIGASSVSIPGLTSAGLSSTLSGLGVNINSLSSTQAIPQVQYEDLGLTMKITPSIQRSEDVALKFDLKLTSLQGSSLNGLPVLNNESYTANITVPVGASALLISDLSRQQSKAVTGVPGLTDLPGFQDATNDQTQLNTTDLVIVVTPHLLRRRHNEQMGPLIPLGRHT